MTTRTVAIRYQVLGAKAAQAQMTGMATASGRVATANAGAATATANAGNAARRAGPQMARAGTGMRSAATGAGLLNPAILGPTGVVAGFGMAASAAMEFNDSQLALETQIGLTTEQAESLGEAAREVGTQYGIGGQAAIDASWQIASAGLRGQDATDALERSAAAAALGFGDVNTVADLVTSAMNAYGPEVLGAADATDILATAIREGKADPEEMASSMGMVLPIAAELGVEFEELAGTQAAMTRTGTSASQAATQLRQVMMNILKPSTQARDALAEVGLSAQDLRDQIREEGLFATLGTLKDAFGDNEEAMAQVFGNARSLMGVLDLMGANVEENTAIMDAMADSAGAIDEGIKRLEETSTRFKLDRFKSEIKTAIEQFGQFIDPVTGWLLDFANATADTQNPALGLFNTLFDTDFGETNRAKADVGPDHILPDHLTGDMAEIASATRGAGDAASESAEDFSAFNEAMAEAGEQWTDLADQFLDPNQAMSRAMAENKEAAQAAADAHNEASDGASKSWEDFADDFPVSMAQVTEHLEDVNQEFRDWRGDVETIAERAGGDVAERLAMMGPEWAPIVAEAVDATAEELAALDRAMADNIEMRMAAAEMAVQMQILEEVARQGGNATVDSIAEALGAAPEVVEEVMAAIGHPVVQISGDLSGLDAAIIEMAAKLRAAGFSRNQAQGLSTWSARLTAQAGAVPSAGGGGSTTGGRTDRSLSADAARAAQGRADGGQVLAGQPYWVGERGPELLVPPQTGRIVPAPQASRSHGGTLQGEVNVNLDGRKIGSSMVVIDAMEGTMRSIDRDRGMQ